MKIAFCLFKYFPFGGMQRDFLRIAAECLHRGHEVDVFTMSWQGESIPGIRIHVIANHAWQNHTKSQQFVQAIAPKLRHYDKVVGFNKMPGLDVYYAADTCYQAKAERQARPWYRLTPRYQQLIAFERSVFSPHSQTDILLLSSMQQAEFKQYYGTPDERFHLLPPGISKDRIAPDNAAAIRHTKRLALAVPENDFILLMVGSGFKTKGVDRALLSAASLPNAIRARTHLFIIGQDNPTRFLKQAKKLKIANRVHFLGGRNDIPDFLLAADLLIHPAYNENTGTILLEALVAGLPVLTTDVCGYAHFINDANAGCVLTSPFQQARLNQAVHDMLISAEQRLAWKQNALTFAKTADIYRLPICAVDMIEQPANKNVCKQLPDDFDQLMNLTGEVYRSLEGRCTSRVVFNNEAYFIKQHRGVGWREIWKNLFQLRLPVLGAKNEYRAIKRLTALGIPTLEIVNYGCKGLNPATRQSFLLTRELPACISLEDLSKNWQTEPPLFCTKLALIKTVAHIARVLHTDGINHRDFYLCHFLLDRATQSKVYLIDLHRAQIRKKTPRRWIIKDLAGLWFSSKEINLTRRDILRFIREYRNKPLGAFIKKETIFWHKVEQRGNKLYREQRQTHNTRFTMEDVTTC